MAKRLGYKYKYFFFYFFIYFIRYSQSRPGMYKYRLYTLVHVQLFIDHRRKKNSSKQNNAKFVKNVHFKNELPSSNSRLVVSYRVGCYVDVCVMRNQSRAGGEADLLGFNYS